MQLILEPRIGRLRFFDIRGKSVCIQKVPARTHYDEKGNSVYKPCEIWEQTSKLITSALEHCKGEIVGISVTSMAEAVVPIDKSGNECFDIITWFDTRAYKEVRQLADSLGKEKLYSITGLDPNPIFSLGKILWMKNNHPDIFDRAMKWLQMGDYIIYKLTGVMATDYTLASRTLAFDILKNNWSEEILNIAGIDKNVFPQIIESGKTIGVVTSTAYRETGLEKGIPVVVGGNDHPCAILPAGVLNGNKVLDSSGTAESFIWVSPENEIPKMVFKGQRTCRFLDPKRYALWGGIISSGASFDWIFRILISQDEWGSKQSDLEYQDVLSQLECIAPGSNGLIFIPHLRGSGAPLWNPKMKGSFLGLKSTTTQKEMLKAVMEGLSFQARMIIDMHKNIAEKDFEALCVVGGGGNNLVWQQIKADILQMPVEVCFEPDASALGTAMLAGVGTGIFDDIADAAKKVTAQNKIIFPEKTNKCFYDELYEVYKMGNRAITSVCENLHNMSLKA